MLSCVPATPADYAEITAIYADYVLHSTVTFEVQPPGVHEIGARVQNVAKEGLPYYVARWDNQVVGYAYATNYRSRPAYRHTAEDSIYLKTGFAGRGIGRALMQHVLDASAAAGRRQMIAVIGDSGNTASIALHTRMGFAHVGVFKDVGYKFGRYIDTVLMQKTLV